MPRKAYLLEFQRWIQVENLVPNQVSGLGCRMVLQEVRLPEDMAKRDMELQKWAFQLQQEAEQGDSCWDAKVQRRVHRKSS